VKEITDKLTYAIKIATDILFVRNPVGTSMGVLGGVIFSWSCWGLVTDYTSS
jgi:hypothetical protein